MMKTSLSPKISAIVCTHNRADYLSKAIESLVKQTLSTDLFEILVVDNVSTDRTCEVVANCASQRQNIRYFYEPHLGLSVARNTGYKNAKGEYVAYLDDDAVASPQWLEKIVETFENEDLDVGIVTGPIEPIWECPPPSWFSERLDFCLAINRTHCAMKTDKPLFAGVNMALRRDVLEGVNGFNDSLGRKGVGHLLSGEEIFLFYQLKAKGYYVFFHPSVTVGHHISAARVTKRYFLKRIYWEGITEALIKNHFEYSGRIMKYHYLFYRFRKMVVDFGKMMAGYFMTGPESKKFINLALLWRDFGFLIGNFSK